MAQRFHRADQEQVLRDSGAYHKTKFDCRLYFDPRFRDGYVHARTWKRSPVYYLSTFRRRDLWERTPAEAVLDEAPPELTGPRARLENGLELLGGEVEADAVAQGHAVFVTTWWRLPGPRSEDLMFFVHLRGRGGLSSRASNDHVPGDWMYPASRWRDGQILEDRVLFQVSRELPSGEYDCHVGVFNRATGERVEVVEGGDDDDRVPVGTLRIRPARLLLDPLVPRTDPAEQRRRMSRDTRR